MEKKMETTISGYGFRVVGRRIRAQGLGLGGWRPGFSVYSLGLRVKGLRFGVWGCGIFG